MHIRMNHGLSWPEVLLNPKMTQVNKGNNAKTSKAKEEELVQVQWKAGMMYWQHPSFYPLPNNLFGKTTKHNHSKRKKGKRKYPIQPMYTSNNNIKVSFHSLEVIPLVVLQVKAIEKI